MRICIKYMRDEGGIRSDKESNENKGTDSHLGDMREARDERSLTPGWRLRQGQSTCDRFCSLWPVTVVARHTSVLRTVLRDRLWAVLFANAYISVQEYI